MGANCAVQPRSEATPSFNLVFGLLCKCPGQLKSNCVLAEPRKLSLREQYEWAKSLNQDELERIYFTHQRCLHQQTRKLLARG